MCRPISRVLSCEIRPPEGNLNAHMCNHPSWLTRYRGARAAYPVLLWNEQPLTRERAMNLLGLAPDGGCLAADVTTGTGGLLHHLFTLT